MKSTLPKVPPSVVSATPLQRRRQEAERQGMLVGNASVLLKELDATLSQRLPRAFLYRNHLILIKFHGDTMIVETTELASPINEIARAFGDCKVQGVLVTDAGFRLLWSMIDVSRSTEGVSVSGVANAAFGLGNQPAHAVKDRALGLFDSLLLAAIEFGASDLHLERNEDKSWVRLRVDGELADMNDLNYRWLISPH